MHPAREARRPTGRSSSASSSGARAAYLDSPEESLDHVAGFVAANDLSERGVPARGLRWAVGQGQVVAWLLPARAVAGHARRGGPRSASHCAAGSTVSRGRTRTPPTRSSMWPTSCTTSASTSRSSLATSCSPGRPRASPCPAASPTSRSATSWRSRSTSLGRQRQAVDPVLERSRLMAGEYDGLVAVVTGGGSGIGAAIAAELLARGARRRGPRPGPVRLPRDAVLAITVDVCDDDSVRAGVDEVARHVGPPGHPDQQRRDRRPGDRGGQRRRRVAPRASTSTCWASCECPGRRCPIYAVRLPRPS